MDLKNPSERKEYMAEQIEINERLVSRAQRLGGHVTEGETVEAALREYVQRREQDRVLQLFGRIEWDPDYDYKTQRRRC